MKLIILLSSLIAISATALVPIISAGRQLRCKFTITHHTVLLDNTYTCEVTGHFTIMRKGDQVTSIIGVHLLNKSNDDVVAFKADAARFEYFPKGLEKIFKNLLSILINFSRLREIRQVDLKPFQKLKHLDLFDNKIEVLEQDLFKFNRDLEVIWLSSNNIKVVDWSTFDGLKKLKSLYMGDNICVGQSAENIQEVQTLIAKIKINCQPSDDPSDPNEITTPQPDDESTLSPDANQTMILIRQLYLTQDEVDRLKNKREELLMKWTKVEAERDLLRENQTDLISQIEGYEKLNRVLNDTIKKGDSESVTYIREAFQLRNELQRQMNTFERIANGYKSQLYGINATLDAVMREKNEYKVESSHRLAKSLEFRDKFDELQAKKENHDLIMIIAICVLVVLLVIMIAPSVYGRFQRKSTGSFNSFENAMRVKMVEVQEVEGEN